MGDWLWIVAVVAVVALVVLVIWLLRWRDSSWNEEAQGKTFTWSKRGGGGGAG